MFFTENKQNVLIITVHLYYQKTENIKKATDNVFGGLQAKRKVRIKYFEVKITELHLV